jgi:polysaccharide export outer membrane protein
MTTMNHRLPCRGVFPSSGNSTIWRFSPVAALIFLLGIAGCTSPTFEQASLDRPTDEPESLVLREGDVIRVTFPGAPNLNTQAQPIRRDGRVTLPLVGEVVAAGKTPVALEQELTNLYSGQLVLKEVNVSVEASSFAVYVTGAVLRPGRVDSNKPITALQAIMEAGGFDYSKANMKGVVVSRTTEGHAEHFRLNLKRVLEGKETEPFYLKPSDIIYVPERFNWF